MCNKGGKAGSVRKQATWASFLAPQHPRYKTQRNVHGWKRKIAFGPVGQQTTEQPAKAMPLEKSGKGRQPGVRRNFLIGETDLDGLTGGLQFNKTGH